MQADDPDVDVWLGMCADYFARRAECVERCRRILSERSAAGAVDPRAVAFLISQFDQLDAAVRHGAGLVARLQRDRSEVVGSNTRTPN